MNNEFIKIDLHIHTPASTTCYKGKKDEEEYFRILRIAKRKAIRIIAITDHNSINGYRKLMDLKRNLLEQKSTLTSITDSDQTQSKLDKIRKKLTLFENILILPGIEFEVRNGIHLLVIFNDTVQIEQIQKFLTDGGYEKNDFGRENPTILSSWDIFALYEESQKYDCIVIDAHTDSQKGILNTIPKARVKCLTAPQLCAVSYNESQKEKLLQVLNTAQEYRRQRLLL